MAGGDVPFGPMIVLTFYETESLLLAVAAA
jgi:hypothetical protein